MKRTYIITLFCFLSGLTFSQSKKEQILSLNATIDSCKTLINNQKLIIDSLQKIIIETNSVLKAERENSIEKAKQLTSLEKEKQLLTEQNRQMKSRMEEDQKYHSITGKYVYETSNSSGSILLIYTGNKKFSFEIIVGTETCNGEISGLGMIDEKGIGRFSMDDCEELIFNFVGNRILIAELNCDYYHGANCGFYGEYIHE